MGDEAGMVVQPAPHELAVMIRDIVGEQMDGGDCGGDGLVEVLQEGEVLDLALAPGGDSVGPSGAGVEGGEQMSGPGPTILVLDLEWSPRLGRTGGDAAWSWLERGHLIKAEHHLVLGQEAGQQVGDGPDLRRERRVARAARVQPDLGAPGLQAVRCQQTLHRLGRDRRHDLVADELPRELGAVPLAERAAGLLGQFAGAPHQVQAHLRGKTSGAARSVDGPPTRRGRPYDTDPPRCGPRWAGPPAAERSGRAASPLPPVARSGHAAPARPRPSSAELLPPAQHGAWRPTQSPDDYAGQACGSLDRDLHTIRHVTLLPSTPQPLRRGGT